MVSARALADAFTPAGDEVVWARENTTTGDHLPAPRARRAEVLRVDPATRRSESGRLKTPAKAAAMGQFELRQAHLADLDALGPTEAWLGGVPPGKISQYAGEERVTDAADFSKI